MPWVIRSVSNKICDYCVGDTICTPVVFVVAIMICINRGTLLWIPLSDLASERNCYCVKVFEFVYLRCLTKACLWVIGKGIP